jgi:hypothetical protein
MNFRNAFVTLGILAGLGSGTSLANAQSAKEAARAAKAKAVEAIKPDTSLLLNPDKRQTYLDELRDSLNSVIENLGAPYSSPPPVTDPDESAETDLEYVPVCVTRCAYGPHGRRIVRTWTEILFVLQPKSTKKVVEYQIKATIRTRIREELLIISKELGASLNIDEVIIRSQQVLGLLALIERLEL